MKQITYAILGYGARGQTFAALLKRPELFGKVVAVVEPNPDRRALAATQCNLHSDAVFEDASELFAKPYIADGIINTTMDRLHTETSIPAMKKGYHLLLEKPMAVTEEDCAAIERTQRETGVVVGVCHSLRYNAVYSTVKEMIDAGMIGEIMSIDQLEGVGYIHYSSSYVRGNWHKEATSCFMLMAKSCHDIDLLSFLSGRRCLRVSSFGSLSYFTLKNKPAGAPSRCLEGCAAESKCPYHCGKVYLSDTTCRQVFPKQDDDSIVEYLRTGPYGRCVFDSDNDVVDHQVVNLEYEGGLTATFTMTAFHPSGRYMRIHGTKGFMQVQLEERTISLTNFATGNSSTITVPAESGTHGGGDYRVIKSVTNAIRKEDPSMVLTTAQESLDSHLVVFAAERARKEKRVVEIPKESSPYIYEK